MSALSVVRVFRSAATIALVLYVCLFIYGYFFAERLIFQPHPSSYADTTGIVKLTSADGSMISAVYLSNLKARFTILFSHGNAEDIGDLMPMFQNIRQMGFGVLAYDYHGYGTSAGRPSEQRAYQDEDAAYDFLTKTEKIPANRIIALGRSLGGGMAVDLASRRPVAGLIIQSSFVTSFRVMTHVPLLPFDRFRSISKLPKVHCPVLVIHGKADEVIAVWHGEALYRVANEPKHALWVERAGHDDLFEVAGTSYGKALRSFAASIDTL